MEEPRRPSHVPWALAAAAVAIVAIVAGAGLYVFRSARSLPSEMAEGGRQALQKLGEVAAAFRTGTVTTTFRGDATRLRGTSRSRRTAATVSRASTASPTCGAPFACCASRPSRRR